MPKGSQKGTKWSQKGINGQPKCITKSTVGTNREKGAKSVASDTWKWEPFWDYLPSKMPLEINTKVDGEREPKGSQRVPEGSQRDAKENQKGAKREPTGDQNS